MFSLDVIYNYSETRLKQQKGDIAVDLMFDYDVYYVINVVYWQRVGRHGSYLTCEQCDVTFCRSTYMFPFIILKNKLIHI